MGACADFDLGPQDDMAAPSGGTSDSATGTRTDGLYTQGYTNGRNASAGLRRKADSRALQGASSGIASQSTEMMEARASFMVQPGKGASVEERRRFVLRQLDSLGEGMVVLGKFVLLDASERCHGGTYLFLSVLLQRLLMNCVENVWWCVAGQAVVQFAHGKLDKQDYAIKFFLSRKGFQAEEALYRHTTLGQFLPQAWLSSLPVYSSAKHCMLLSTVPLNLTRWGVLWSGQSCLTNE